MRIVLADTSHCGSCRRGQNELSSATRSKHSTRLSNCCFDHLLGGIDRIFYQEQLDCQQLAVFLRARVQLGDFADASVGDIQRHLQRLFVVGNHLTPQTAIQIDYQRCL